MLRNPQITFTMNFGSKHPRELSLRYQAMMNRIDALGGELAMFDHAGLSTDLSHTFVLADTLMISYDVAVGNL